MGQLELRAYTPRDLDAIAALDALCFQPPFRFSKRAMQRFAEAENAVVRLAYTVGDADPPGELAGFCILHLERENGAGLHGYIVTLDVAARFRGRGVGQTLLRAVEGAAAQAGAAEMRLHVSVHNPVAQRLYERLGYGAVRVEPAFYGTGGDAIVYRLDLQSQLERT